MYPRSEPARLHAAVAARGVCGTMPMRCSSAGGDAEQKQRTALRGGGERASSRLRAAAANAPGRPLRACCAAALQAALMRAPRAHPQRAVRCLKSNIGARAEYPRHASERATSARRTPPRVLARTNEPLLTLCSAQGCRAAQDRWMIGPQELGTAALSLLSSLLLRRRTDGGVACACGCGASRRGGVPLTEGETARQHAAHADAPRRVGARPSQQQGSASASQHQLLGSQPPSSCSQLGSSMQAHQRWASAEACRALLQHKQRGSARRRRSGADDAAARWRRCGLAFCLALATPSPASAACTLRQHQHPGCKDGPLSSSSSSWAWLVVLPLSR